MNDRRAPLALGIAGLCVGVLAAFTPGVVSSVLAVVAGLTALGVGYLAMAALTAADRERLEQVRTIESEHRSRLEQNDRHLAEARERIRDLELAVEERASVPEDRSDDTTVLTDPDSHLFSEAYFHVALDARIASARRHLRPVAVALIEVFEGIAGPTASPAPPERAAESIRQTIRDADTACRLNDGVYAIILEDTPENGAVWTVERVRRNLVSRYGSHTMWAGVACYPAHAFSTEELLEQTRAALESAREWKQDRIEVAISE